MSSGTRVRNGMWTPGPKILDATPSPNSPIAPSGELRLLELHAAADNHFAPRGRLRVQ
jgi:hypothetical protein